MTSHSTPSDVHRKPVLRGGLAAGFAGLGLLALAGCAVPQAEAEESTESSPSASATPKSTSVYADGTYSAEAAYQAPSGIESVSVTITLVDDVVTEVTSTADAVDHEAREFQERFAAGISAEVVGKDIAGLSVSRVSGASLTGNGFNTAIEQIRSEALA